MTDTPKRVVVGLSGGVDSSVSAALLKQQGYLVEGAFIKPWSPPWMPCTWRTERDDARTVAAQLGIPFHTVDLSIEYERDVVEYLVREYRLGHTPNPDVMCNRYIKFGSFFEWAMKEGFDLIATGHYARIRASEDRIATRYELLAGVDVNKDQSYFLWTLTQDHLARTLFPVGELEKPQVRDLATQYGLSTAGKKDSQGVCFLGKLNMRDFLQHYIPSVPGAVLDTSGARVGMHEGAAFYTLGQRHGFTVNHSTDAAVPLYVVAKDVDSNTITVAPRGYQSEHEDRSIPLHGVHWIMGSPPNRSEKTYDARLRYRQPLFRVRITQLLHDTATVLPEQHQPYIPLGQSLVLYDGEVCLGGGVIG